MKKNVEEREERMKGEGGREERAGRRESVEE